MVDELRCCVWADLHKPVWCQTTHCFTQDKTGGENRSVNKWLENHTNRYDKEGIRRYIDEKRKIDAKKLQEKVFVSFTGSEAQSVLPYTGSTKSG